MTARYVISDFRRINQVRCHKCHEPASLGQFGISGKWLMLEKVDDATYERGHYYTFHQCWRNKYKWMTDKLIDLDGDVWRVVNIGRVTEDGEVYVLLSSTTRFVTQTNGECPIQREQLINPREVYEDK